MMKKFIVLSLVSMAAHGMAAPVRLVDELPVQIARQPDGAILIDFGRVAFGNVRLMPPGDAGETVTVHFGEALLDGRINRRPPGTVRYHSARVKLDGSTPAVAAPPPDARNTKQGRPPAILTPSDWGVVLPFRWVELEGWSGDLLPEQIVRQAAFASAWDDDAAAFESSDEMLNRIWELCRYSIKATTFAGIYVDGDRERIPYEADAYLNQLGHYTTGTDIRMARDTIDHLLKYPTWPSEWAPHLVFMVHADWMQTGDTTWLAGRYEALTKKTLSDRVGADGLVASDAKQIKRTDLVDWPSGERDGYVFTARNTVVNAFHLRALAQMAELARALGKNDDAAEFEARARATGAAFQQRFFDAGRALYRDGIQTGHCSLHANLFPLAFGLAPEADRSNIAEWLARRGMRCSVYAAQYLLEGLFENGADRQALKLMTAPGDRSWRHMVESGATITWEAWDLKYKGNQDWNHAWGAAPANLLPRYVLGAQPLTPGWASARIVPRIGNLTFAKGKVPTPLGPVFIDWSFSGTFNLSLILPEGMSARVELPPVDGPSSVFCDGRPVSATRVANRWVLDQNVSGAVEIEVRPSR
jgi:hypothetical protein